MSLVDTLKGLVGKGKEAAAKKSDKVGHVIDKAGDVVDKKTGGKHSDTISKAKEAAKKVIPPSGDGPSAQG